MSSESNVYGDYVPSKVAAIIGAIVFLILTLLQLWRIITQRKWFGLAIVTGGLFEVIGLAARAYSRDHLSETTPYIIQILLILLAPILFAASIYMFLGRLIYASGHPHLSFIRINWLTKIFVIGDVFCFFVQAAGAAKLVNAETSSDIDAAQNIVLGGLGLQVAVFCVFALCAVVFHVRVSAPRFRNLVPPGLHLHAMLFSLYASSLLITVRNAYRLVEYTQGNDGYLTTHEWPTYGLDIILMAIIMVITLFWYSAVLNQKVDRETAYPLVYQELGAGRS
ncbi:RTA1 like protein-domain-containing protein [Aspergillus minisclerotigenes]|uniref:RTA1 like protein-domain-containing protein n=1 Tax=Aspergillus minisclerotigenes TaxID=656917 RepID=A0A5N6JGK0_9EURO|nr:RTA1 like protein-domain-containing protein [Aspergillus minisclerotigenes]